MTSRVPLSVPLRTVARQPVDPLRNGRAIPAPWRCTRLRSLTHAIADMLRFVLLLLLCVPPLRAQLTMTPVLAKTVAGTTAQPVISGVRYARWTILARRDSANSVQAADFSFWNWQGVVLGWGPKVTVTNPDGGPWPTGEEPDSLVDMTRGATTKWLTMRFAALDTARRGRTVILIDNGEPLSEPIAGYTWWTANDLPARDPVEWIVDISADGRTWVRFDSVRVLPPLARHSGAVNRRRAAEALVPDGAAPIASLSCDGHPNGFAVRSGGTSYTGLRTERTTVLRGESCLGVVTLRTASSYMIHIRTASGWRSPTTAYSSRAAAEAAIVAAGGK